MLFDCVHSRLNTDSFVDFIWKLFPAIWPEEFLQFFVRKRMRDHFNWEIRYVPMTEAVAACFRRIIANRKTPKVEPMVEGYAGFLFLDKNDMPMVALSRRHQCNLEHLHPCEF